MAKENIVVNTNTLEIPIIRVKFVNMMGAKNNHHSERTVGEIDVLSINNQEIPIIHVKFVNMMDVKR